ncbi:hypothetical protein CC86DRAFT_281524 [Ophiobolus disseminans]|uniref:Uncharacterized protein n=1 Tax=Ophiobolus disseminans TaxID=1469910 RepID=A0A6A7AI64_9PLEO|nr:hypothetical protein CC86DRAFT_281524 [Ophiobolus disseminans]
MAPGNGNYHFDNGEIDPEPYDPEMPRLRGGDASFHSYGVNGNHAQWNVPTPATGNGFGPLPGQGAGGGPEPDFYEVPAHDFYAARGGDRPRHVPASGTCAPAAEQFDFNDQQQPNPWQKAPKAVPQPQRPREPERQPEPEVEVRCFADCRNDRDLRGYIDSRNISVGFLTEIDLLIEGHPELKTFPGGLHTLRQLYTLPPLDALKYFLKGYTRPARYPDGIIRTDNFPLPPGYPYQPLSTKTDPELVEFFDGFEYRHDIIERIDQEVRGAMRELAHGGTIPVALRKLVCYAIWGNPVDAYKWFEYSYQREYMPHRYLPEHVVLGHIPKPAGYTEPRPLTDRSFKKHMDVRARMAQANDQGVGTSHSSPCVGC